MIVLATAASREYESLARITRENKREYCKRHGLVLSSFTHTEPISCWERPKIWRQVLEDAEWLFWTGCDAAITNLTIDVRDLFDDNADLIIAADGNGINNDVFLMRRNSATLRFMDAVVDCERRGVRIEQDAMSVVLSGAPDYPQFTHRLPTLYQEGKQVTPEISRLLQTELNKTDVRVKIVSQRVLNAYPHQYYGMNGTEDNAWGYKSFVAHMPGTTLEQRIEFFSNPDIYVR